MKLTEYQELAARTIPHGNLSKEELLDNFAMGLVGETGEVFEIFKKHWYHGKKLDLNKLKEELGGVLWYLFGIATLLDIQVEIKSREPITENETVEDALHHLNTHVTANIYNDVFNLGVDVISFGHIDNVEFSSGVLDIAIIAAKNGTSLNDVMEYNITQLKERHPNGFDPSYHDTK